MTPRRLLNSIRLGVRQARQFPLGARGPIFIVSSLVVTFAVIALIGLAQVRRAHDGADKWMMRSSAVAADQFDLFVRQGTDGVKRLAEWPGIAAELENLRGGQTGRIAPWVMLSHLSAGLDIFRECIFVTDRNGIVVWTKPLGLGLLGTDVSRDPVVREVFGSKRPYVSNLLRGGLWPEPHVLAGMAVRNERGDAVGMIGGVMDPRLLPIGVLAQEVLEHSDGVEVYVTDAEGSILASTNPSRTLGSLEEEEAAALADLSARLEHLVHIRGHEVVLGVHRLREVRDWAVVISQSDVDLHQGGLHVERTMVGAGVLLGVVILLLTLPFVNSIVQPVERLTGEAKRIAGGDLETPVAVDGRDEITDLARAFEEMRLQVFENRRTLQAHVAELAEMNRLKNEFIANLSHEFRTPIHIGRGYLDLILDGALGDVPNTLKAPLESVRRSNDVLWELIDNCLDLAKIDAGKHTLKFETFDLRDLVRECVEEFSAVIRHKGLRRSVRVPDTPCTVVSDRAKLARILRNLVGNAVKFTEAGEVAVSLEEGFRGSEFRLQVRDTGIGISQANQKRIFERFRQVDGSTTRSYSGVGLGLSIATELVELLGGTISVVSTVNEGSVFTVTLPRLHPAAEAKRAEQTASGADGRERDSESGDETDDPAVRLLVATGS